MSKKEPVFRFVLPDGTHYKPEPRKRRRRLNRDVRVDGTPTEHAEQVALIEWRDLRQAAEPRLGLLFAIPNGGKRSVSVATQMKAEGVLAGVPDLFLPVAMHNYHGLMIELKVKGNYPDQKQKDMLSALKAQGYCVQVCYGWVAARDFIVRYLGMEPED